MPSHVTFKWKGYFLPDDVHIAWVDLSLLESDGQETVVVDGVECRRWVNPAWVNFLTPQGVPRAATSTLMDDFTNYIAGEYGKGIGYEFPARDTVRLHVTDFEITNPARLQRICNRLTERVTNRIALLDPAGEVE